MGYRKARSGFIAQIGLNVHCRGHERNLVATMWHRIFFDVLHADPNTSAHLASQHLGNVPDARFVWCPCGPVTSRAADLVPQSHVETGIAKSKSLVPGLDSRLCNHYASHSTIPRTASRLHIVTILLSQLPREPRLRFGKHSPIYIWSRNLH